MTINYACMAINDPNISEDTADSFSWADAKYHPDFAHWRDGPLTPRMGGYKGIAIVPDAALSITGYPPAEYTKQVYNRREVEVVGEYSGVSGLHIAIMEGYNPIFLIAYDYYEDANGTHGYPGPHSQYWPHRKVSSDPDAKYTLYEASFNGFERLKNNYPDVEVFNLSEESLLLTFPYLSLDEALEMVN